MVDTTPEIESHDKALTMGLGEAVLRLIHVEQLHSLGIHMVPQQLRDERALIVEALNQYNLDLNFACEIPDAAEDVQIFKQTAETSCCRIVPPTGGVQRRVSTSRLEAPKKKDPEAQAEDDTDTATSVEAVDVPVFVRPRGLKKRGIGNAPPQLTALVPSRERTPTPSPVEPPQRRGLRKKRSLVGTVSA